MSDKNRKECNAVANVYIKTLIGVLMFFVGGGSFGVFVQKGMIEAMGLGNIQGEYSVDEIVNSAALGAAHVFVALLDIKFWEVFLKDISVPIIISMMLFLLGVIVFWKDFSVFQFLKNHQINFDEIKYSKKLKWCAPFIMGILAFPGFFMMLVLFTLIVGLFCILVLIIPIFGTMIGSHQISSKIDEDPCVGFEGESYKSERVRQCTHFSINGRQITGQILLQNKTGYFMKTNNAFLYFDNKGETCIYSKYDTKANVEVRSNNDKPLFLKSEIDTFCNLASKSSG